MRQFTNKRGDIRWQPTVGDDGYYWRWTGVDTRRQWHRTDDGTYLGSPVLYRRQKTAARVESKRQRELDTNMWTWVTNP